MSDRIFTVSTTETTPSCTITVRDGMAVFEGDYYEYREGEFCPVRQGRTAVNTREFLGLGYLKKRSNKRLLLFLAVTGVFSFLGSVSEKLDYLFFLNTDWLAALMNGVLAVSVLGFVFFLFSRKDVVEITFVGKRICIDRNRLTEKDIGALQQALKTAGSGVY